MFFSATFSSSLMENCYTSAHVPGKKVKKNLGLVQYSVKGCKGKQVGEMERVFNALLNLAKEKGATSVVNIKMNCGSYQENGSGWVVSFLTVFGDAVILEPDEN